MTQVAPVVFLLDVDNTLLDNDRFTGDLKLHLTPAFGAARKERYWAIFEKLREELGYADYLRALQRQSYLRVAVWAKTRGGFRFVGGDRRTESSTNTLIRFDRKLKERSS